MQDRQHVFQAWDEATKAANKKQQRTTVNSFSVMEKRTLCKQLACPTKYDVSKTEAEERRRKKKEKNSLEKETRKKEAHGDIKSHWKDMKMEGIRRFEDYYRADRSERKASSSQLPPERDMARIKKKCYLCQKTGHLDSECKKRIFEAYPTLHVERINIKITTGEKKIIT
ncbi:ARID DNA-binding domain-containing protein [Tanacetum coccineum]